MDGNTCTRLTQQSQQDLLLVSTETWIPENLSAHLGQPERLIQFPIGQQPGIGSDLASQESQLQAGVETYPQFLVLAVIRWVLLSLWHLGRKTAVFQGSGAKYVPHVTFSSGKCGLRFKI